MKIVVMEDVEIRELLENNVKSRKDLARVLWTIDRYADTMSIKTGDWKWSKATEPFYSSISNYLDESFFDEEESY